MELSILRRFIRVAETGSVARTATQLGVAQPGLSRQIRVLEEQLGTTLFERDGRGVILTQAGARFYRQARNILNRSQSAVLGVAAEQGEPLDTLVLGIVPSIGRLSIVDIVMQMRRIQPRVSVRIVEGPTENLLAWLHEGRLDLVLSYYDMARPLLRFESIVTLGMHLVGTRERLVGQDAFSFHDLCDTPLILPRPISPQRILIESIAEAQGVDLQVIAESDSLSVMTSVAATGRCCAIIPELGLRLLKDIPHLASAPIRELAEAQNVVLARAANRDLSPVVNDLAMTATRVVREKAVEFARTCGCQPSRPSL